MNGEEDHNSAYRNGCRERGRDDVVVPGPEGEEPLLEVDHREDGDGKGGPLVGQVVRSPVDTTVDEWDRVDLSEPRVVGELLHRVVEDDGNEETDGESGKDGSVLAAAAEHPVWAEGSPDDRGGEEGVDTWAGHSERGLGRADVGHVDLEVEDTGADERGDEGGDDLGGKGVSGWDLDVVGELQVVGKGNGVGASDVSEGFYVVVSGYTQY